MRHHPTPHESPPPREKRQSNFPQRRRTQIRLAQRAYRDRKETAIQTLEKKVSSLQDSNDEMSRAFAGLYDAAAAQGLLASAPGFARDLRAAAERFVALARAGDAESGDGGSVGSGRLSDEPEAWDAVRHARSASGDAVLGTGSTSPELPVSSAWAEPRNTIYPLSDIVTPSARDCRTASGPRPTDMPLRPSPHPTQLGTSHGRPPGIPPPLAPPTHTHQERTFGRRLQRSALEQGLLLLHLPTPPPHIYAAVFGFCLLFESREDIVKRVTDAISRSPRRTLDCWDRPFWRLGGAGESFGFVSADFSDGSSLGDEPLVGNQGCEGAVLEGGLGAMGPFGVEVEEVRDLRVDKRMRMLVPGFEGDFFDPDEVEVFLRRRGVYIPPASDFVTAEIDVGDFVLGAEGAVDGGASGPALGVLTGDVSASYLAGTAHGIGTPMEADLGLLHTADGDPSAAFGSGGLPSLDAIDFDFSLPDMNAFGKTPTRRRVTINVTTLVEGMYSDAPTQALCHFRILCSD